MNLKEDKDLLYIAKEGLKAPLPNPWKVIIIFLLIKLKLSSYYILNI
jgi:hypothetical protein